MRSHGCNDAHIFRVRRRYSSTVPDPDPNPQGAAVPGAGTRAAVAFPRCDNLDP